MEREDLLMTFCAITDGKLILQIFLKCITQGMLSENRVLRSAYRFS